MGKQGKPDNGTTVEARVVRQFLRMVGANSGLYNPSTKQFAAGLESEALYQTNLEAVRSLLANGWGAVDLERHIANRYNAGERSVMLLEIMPKKPEVHRIDEGDNLLDEEAVYLHPTLFDRGFPSYAVQGGAMVPMAQGSQTPKVSFTLGEIVDRYFQLARRGDIPRQRAATINKMRWLLGQATLDEVLFSLDLAAATGNDFDVFSLQDYLLAARAEIHVCEARGRE